MPTPFILKIWETKMYSIYRDCEIGPWCIMGSNGPNLSSNPTPCFLLPIMIKRNNSTTMKTKALLEFSAFTCFIDKELVWQLKLPLVKKITPMAVEVIDGQNLFSSPMMHETKVLKITIGSHTSKVVFDVISSPTDPIIIGLFWLILHNP